MYKEIEFRVNGNKVLYSGNPLRRLVDVLREDLGLLGVKEACGEGECASQAFLRRLRTDDPSREVFCEYFEEMYSRFSSAKEVKPTELIELMKKKETRHQGDVEVYRLWTLAANAENAAAVKEEGDQLSSLFRSKQLQPIIDANGIVILDENGQKITDAEQLIASFQDFERLVRIPPTLNCLFPQNSTCACLQLFFNFLSRSAWL